MKIKYDLKKMDMIDYENVINIVLDKLKNNDFVLAVYQFGSISKPGVSDIDFLIVINNVKNYFYKKKVIKDIINYDELSRYCFFHDAIIIEKSDIKYINFFHNVEGLKLLFGEDFKMTKVCFSEEQYLKWNSYFIISFLFLIKNKKVVSLRYILLLINNIAYTVKNNDKMLKTDFYFYLKRQVDELRDYCLVSSKEIDIIEEKIVVLINIAYDLLKKQENKRNGFKLFVLFSLKQRSIFITCKYPSLWKIFFVNIITFPTEYFLSRLNHKKSVHNFLSTNKMSKKEYFDLVDRFQSVNYF